MLNVSAITWVSLIVVTSFLATAGEEQKSSAFDYLPISSSEMLSASEYQVPRLSFLLV